MTASQRRATLPLVAVALVAAVLVVPPPPAAAQVLQEATVLVSNTGQTDDDNSDVDATFPQYGQPFTTGSNSEGYTLNSIVVSFGNIASVSTAGSELTVTLNADTSGSPGSSLCTLDDPATFSASGAHTFTAPTTGTLCPELAASTTYFVVITRANNDTNAIAVDLTTSTSEDSGAATGWTIGNRGSRYDTPSSGWAQFSIDFNLQIEVKGDILVATPGVTVSESAVTVAEGGATDSYTVVLDAAPTGDVTIAVTETSDDISLSATSLTFTTATWNTAQNVTVTAVDDSTAEAAETATIQHSVSTTADATNYPTTLTIDSVEVTVTDNDTPGLTFDPTSLTVPEGKTATYTVVLDSQPTNNVDVPITENGANFSVSPTSLSFSTSNWSTPKTVTVTSTEDSIANGNRMFTITHNPSGANYNAASDETLTATVTDNDAKGVTVSESSLSIAESGGMGTYTVKLNSEPTGTVSISIVSSSTSNATVSPASLSFTTSNWNSAKSVTVTGVDDSIVNASFRTATISHGVSGADYESGVSADPVVVTLIDDESVAVKNTAQAVAGSAALVSTTGKRRAQAFTTGLNPAGYTLNSIGIEFAQITHLVNVESRLTATLNQVSGSNPGSVVCTLSHPASYAANALNTYGASSCPTLEASTTYFFVLERMDSLTSEGTETIHLDRTTSPSEDAGSSADWSIANSRYYYTAGTSTWNSTANQAHLIDIRGSAVVPEPPKRATGFDLDSGNSAPRGIWGNDDTFWVANNGSDATDRLYAYNRTDGSRDSGNDFGNLNGNSNNDPEGVCSDGTTMFVADSADNKVYAYNMSDTTADSTKDVTLASGNDNAKGVWCDADTIWVAEDEDGTTSKVYAYKRSDGTHDSAKDVTAAVMNPSMTVGGLNNSDPRGIWGNADTMFVVDDEDVKVYAYKTSDRTRDAAKDIALDTANADAEGLWFDGRVLWVVDDADDKLYVYDLAAGQPDNTPAVGAPVVRSEFTKDVFTATVTPAQNSQADVAGYAVTGVLTGGGTPGSISESEFTVDGVTYTVRAVLDTDTFSFNGDLILELDRELPRGFTFTAAGTSYSSDDATESVPGTGRYRYQWSANLSWRTTAFPVVLSVETPKDGVDVTADPSGITDSTDGVASASFHYQWIRVDGTDETETDIGAVGATYTPTADDVDNYLKVRVVFNDDEGNQEYPITSPRFGPVVDAVAPTLLGAAATTATTIEIAFNESLDPASVPAASAFAIQVGGTVGPVDSVEFHPDSEDAIRLTVSGPLLSRDTITVSYTRPDANPLQDPNRNEVESISGQVVENNIRETFVSNLGQTTATFKGDLFTEDYAQRFDTGSTASFDLTEVEVLFDTAPTSSATVTAVIADGLGSTDNIVATLTNPDTWSTNATFGIPSGTTLAHDTTYYLIIEGTDGMPKTTTADAEDSGAAASWTIGNVASIRTDETQSGVGGTWTPLPSASLQMAVRGKHHGNPGTPELAVTAKDQTLILEVTVPDHGSSNLTGIEYRYKDNVSSSYVNWAPVTRGTVSNEGGTFEIGGFLNGTEYTVQVQTVNDIGTSDPSNEAKATPDAPPEITSVAITSDPGTDKTYAIGDKIVVAVTFDKNITLSTGTGGAPNIVVSIGSVGFALDCLEPTPPTMQLVCEAEIGEGDGQDSDGISVVRNALFLGDRMIVGPLGQTAVITYDALADDANHKVDGIRPTLTGAKASADLAKIILTFSEAIGSVDRTKITFMSGTTALTTTAHSTTGSEVEITLTNALTATDTNVTVALAADAVEDAAGNGNAVLAATQVKLVEEIWSATLTVKNLSGDDKGCNTSVANKCNDSSILTDNDFSYDGRDYVIDIIGLNSGQLEFQALPSWTSASLRDLTLNVGSTSLAFEDATRLLGLLRWSNTGLTWSEGDMIVLSIDADPPPMLETAQVATATTLNLIFDQGLDSSSLPATSAFAVTVNGSSNSVSSATFNTANDGLILTVGTAMSAWDTVVVTYTKPSDNPLQDAAGNETESFGEELENLLRDTLVSNLGQTTASGVVNLSSTDISQAFTTGPTVDAYTFTGVKVKFDTVPTASATVTAFIADGQTATDNIVVNLTNPDAWSATSTFGIPSGTTLAKNTTYYLIVEGSDGTLHRTSSNNEDSGAVTGWSIANTGAIRGASTTGVGGTWTPNSAKLQMSVEGIHKGIPGIPDLTLAAKDQAIELDVAISDHGREDLSDIEYRYKATASGTYTEWTSVTGTVTNTGGTYEITGLTNGTEYFVQVQGVNDRGDGLPSDEETATPDAPPAIDTVVITSDPGMDKTYKIDDDIVVTFTFDKNITLRDTRGTTPPYILLHIGTGDGKEPDCAVGTAPTMVMTCTHTVAENDEDTDGISVAANSISITEQDVVGPLGQLAVRTHSELTDNSDHKVDGVRPELTGARPSADMTKVILTFGEPIGSVDHTKVTFMSGTSTLSTTAGAVSSSSTSEVEITLTTALTAMDTNVTVALAVDAVTDAVGNGNAVLAATALVDETAPELSTATTPSNTEVLLSYNEPLDADSIPAASAFTVVVNTGRTTRTVSTAALDGTSAIKLTVSPAFRPGDVLTVGYTVPETNPIKDASANEAVALANQLVDNTLPATAPDMPGSLAANFNLISFVPPLVFNADLMDLTWTAPWHNGSPIEKFQYRYHTPIWDGTLTVKDLGASFLGCDTQEANKGCQPGELLTVNDFSYHSVNYQIDVIDLKGGTLTLEASRAFTAAALADLTLHVGGDSFPFADATHSAGLLTWSSTGLSWSENDTVQLAIRGPVLAWTDVPDSAPGGANHTSYTVDGLDVDTGYTFEVRAKNGIDFGTAASVARRTKSVVWSFTLRDGGSDVTGLTEGGDSATARVMITNDSRFSTDQTIDLEWGGFSLEDGRIQGAGNTSTITITAGASTGHLDLSVPDNEANPTYFSEAAHDLTAKWEDAVIGTVEQLRVVDDESPPVARITDFPESVNEGDSFDVDLELSIRYGGIGAIKFTITDGDSALSGTLPTLTVLSAGDLTTTVTLTAAENTTQNDGAREVTFTLETSDDIPYTLGTGEEKTVTIIVRDDDTPPRAVGNLRAQAGNTEATLRWQAPSAPTPDHGQPILRYEFQVKVGTGSFGSWATIPNSDGTTTSHKFIGLTNDTEYTYKVRAVNVAGEGAESEVMVTPVIGVAVSFNPATASVAEGSSQTVEVTLATAPAAGTTVEVPITVTPGEGLAATEYSGVPSSVTFAAGDTSKSFTVSTVDDSLDESDEQLTLEFGTLPDGYVPGTNGEMVITVTDNDTALLGLTLRDSGGNDIAELTEGGASATARVSIANSVRFETDQTITLEWGGQEIISGLIQGFTVDATITITAGQSSGTLVVGAPQRPGDLYRPPETKTLTAHLDGDQIGEGIELKYVDDEAPPMFTISLRDTRVVEGAAVFLDGTLSRAYDLLLGDTLTHNVPATGATTRLTGSDYGTVDGQPVTALLFGVGETTSDPTSMTATGNSTAGDHATVTFTIPSNPDYYTIGTPSTATLLILDDDAAPGAPQNPAARPGDTEATLSWDGPTNYDQVWVSDYQFRQRAGTGPWSSWAVIPDSDGETTGHTFTGLTNDIEYTFEFRGRNSNHNGAVAQVMVTPREGIAVSFGAASESITEGGSVTVTVTLGEAPAAGATVEVQITATPGTGLDATDFSGVPASVEYTEGETSETFTVTTVGNDDDEPHRVLTLGLGTLPEGYVPGTNHEYELTILDDDLPIVSATFHAGEASATEGASVPVTVRLSQAPEREVVVQITATRGANLTADEHEAVPSSVTFGPGETEKSFTLKFEDDAVVEGSETLTLRFGTLPDRVNSAGEHPDIVLTVTDDDGPPSAPDVSVGTSGNGFVVLSWEPVVNDSPVLRYEVRWRQSDGGTFNEWVSVGLVTSYRVEDLTNGVAYVFEVQAVNAHGGENAARAQAMPTERLTGTPKVIQGLWVRATDSGRAELSWGRPSNATDKVTANSATATFSQIQGYRIEVCRTTCVGDGADWYALVANTGEFSHRYVHQVLAPGVIRENHYRVRAININGVAGPWSNVATLDATEVEGVYLQTPNDSTLWVRFRVRNPDGNPLYVRYTNTATDAMGYTEYRLTKKQDVRLVLSGLAADSWYRVDLDYSPDFDSPRRQTYWYGTAREGETPLTSPYAVDLVEAQVWRDGDWRDASTTALTIRMGDTGKYRVRLKPCTRKYNVNPQRVSSPAGRLQTSPIDTSPTLFTNLWCEVEGIGFRTDENGNFLTMSDVYDMTNFPDHANDLIPIYGGSPNDWYEVTVTAADLEDYPADRRYDALLSAPFEVKYNHRVSYARDDTRSGLVSGGSGWVRILVDRPADAVLPLPGNVRIGSDRVMTWDAVPGAWGYLVVWRHGAHYSSRANQGRNLQAATSITLPPGASGRGPVTARVRAYSASGVSGWSAEQTWDSRAPTLSVSDTAVNEADGSVGFLVTLDPAANATVTVQYRTVDATAVAPADYTATSGTVTFAPGQTRKQTALVPIVNDGEEDTGETFRLLLSSPTGSDTNNGAAVIGDGEAVATILNSEEEVASLTGFTLVDAATNADLMALADGSTVKLGELLVSSYGIRAEMGTGAAPGSVKLALTGAKTATATDDAAPYSLYGDGAGRINGQALPPGSYTLRATAYADSGGRGDELGSLEVTFTVAAGALGVTTPGPFTVAEGQTAVAQLAASDTGTGQTATWSIPAGADGGADGAAFALTSGGALSLAAGKDFEAPDDADGDGTYEVTVSVTVGAQTATAALSVTLADVDEPALAVTTDGPLTVAEGETAVAALAASATGTGAEASWSIPAGAAGGADGAAFAVASDGILWLVAAKDFEAPDDADGDGVYEVTVAVAVPATPMAGPQSATAVLLVTLTDVNEAPTATATASPARVRQGASVTLDASASTDPDAGDTLTYLWTQADDGAPRVTVSDASAQQPAFTTPSDLESETALAFTLRVTDAAGLHGEAAVTVTVTLISEVSISAASNYAAEGGEAVFALTRAGSARAALTVPVTVTETGEMLGTATPADATFAAGERATELRVPTAADAAPETDSLVTVRLASGAGWQLAPGAEAASVTVLDDDPAPVTETAVADVTIWSADMTVVEYSSRSIGAGTADLFSNQQGRAGLRAKSLWYDPSERVLRLRFDAGLYDAESLTLHVGDVSLGFPDNPGGDSSFTLEGVDVSWTDGETIEARISKPSASAVSTDATLASLGVEAATLSPAFDASVLLYWAVADAGAETVTVSARANDDGATVAYGPAADADAELADHQAAAPTEDDFLVAVTVTAADGTVRLYRVVVAPTAAAGPSNTAPTGAPTITGTAQVGETLTADTSAIDDADGLDDVEFGYQWLAGGSDIAEATGSTHLLTDSEQGQTIQVRVTFTDDADNEETMTSAATVAVAARPNREPTGAPTISGTPQVEQTLTADTSSINDADGLTNVSYAYQWIVGGADIAGATGSSYELTASEQGKTIQVKVTFEDDRGHSETLTSAATVAVAAKDNTAPTGLLTITGTAQVGETLTADTSAIDDADGLDDVEFGYQWLAGGSDREDATDPTYTPSVSDVGKAITVRVSFTDDADNEETLTSEATDPVAATAPTAPQGLTVTEGSQELDVSWEAPSSNGGTDVTGYKVEWKESADSWETPADVSEATASGTAHTITGLTGGVEYSVRVSAVNDAGTGPASDPVSGTPQKAALWSATLTVGTTETFAGYTTFLASTETNILGALSADTFTSDDDSHTVKALGVLDGDLILTVAPKPSFGFVLVAGTTEFASTDASTRATDSLIQYRWTDPGLDWSDGQEVAVRMTNGLPTISGTPQVDETLTAETSPIDDVDGLTNVFYEFQWIAGGLDIAGATGSTYTLTYSEQGKTIAVRVTFTDDADNAETLTSVATVAVAAAPNREATGEPGIGGTPRVGQTLTAETSPIDDPDGLTNVSYRYQWLAGGSDIAGATGSTYELVPADAGSTIEVRVSFTDDRGNSETLTSEATVAVAATTPTAPQGLTVATGDQVQELVASWQAPESNGGSAVTGYRVQWKEAADSWDTAADVSEATETATTHTIAGLTGGVEYAVRVIATNSAGDGPASTEAKGTPAGAASEQTTEAENSAPTGLPTISGTPQVDQTLTADTSPIDDSDGLTNVSYRYQWIAGGSDIGGATGSTYTLTAGEQGKTIAVRVTFTDDADNTETLTSIATVAVAAAPVPLTVSVTVSAPASHDGSSEFAFEIEFSEEFGLSYRTLKFDAFNVTGGSVERAQRTDKPSNIPWRITVKPQGNGDVTIELPATTDCAADGAICTGDGRKLSHSLSFTVPGPGG